MTTSSLYDSRGFLFVPKVIIESVDQCWNRSDIDKFGLWFNLDVNKTLTMKKIVSCIRLTNGFYKLIFSFDKHLKSDPKVLSEPEVQNAFADQFSYNIGWWVSSFKVRSIIITEIDIILPPFGEYLGLEKTLREVTLEENIILTLHTGITIDIPDGDIKNNISYIHQQLMELNKKDIGNN